MGPNTTFMDLVLLAGAIGLGGITILVLLIASSARARTHPRIPHRLHLRH
ncbi:MAG TPA: hypothetical protein VHM65_08555 [Candidatus Lustribacter sp.]|nr:hypothetical protein [Candidatus Lustribacter sp.]